MKKDFSDNDIIHVKSGNIEYIKFRKLEEYKNKINHVITLKHGGVSGFKENSLNFRLLGKDKKENVLTNLERICNSMNISPSNVYKAKQNHTDNILIIDNSNKEKYRFIDVSNEEFDGYICKDKDIATLVTTADCNPIIIYDTKNNIYANVHSGWKGTIKQIYLKAAIKMNKLYNSKYEDLIVCVGPSIKKCCFLSEDEEFKKFFTDVWKDEENYIYYEENSTRFHIDLSYVITKDLLKLGVREENIVIPNICTMCNSDSFFSYRVAKKEGKEDYCTMATIVTLI